MLPSASLDANSKGMYEPVHGSAPDIAGKGLANPLATLLSVAMMWRYTFAREDLAGRLEAAVSAALDAGLRTRDIAPAGGQFELVGTEAMAAAVLDAFVAG
jgi:3-isopropylmalate dehydrogenase